MEALQSGRSCAWGTGSIPCSHAVLGTLLTLCHFPACFPRAQPSIPSTPVGEFTFLTALVERVFYPVCVHRLQKQHSFGNFGSGMEVSFFESSDCLALLLAGWAGCSGWCSPCIPFQRGRTLDQICSTFHFRGGDKPWSDLFTHSSCWCHLSWENDIVGNDENWCFAWNFLRTSEYEWLGFFSPTLQQFAGMYLTNAVCRKDLFFQIKCYNSIFMTILLNFQLWTMCLHNLWQYMESTTFWLLVRTSGGHLPVTAQVLCFWSSCIWVQFCHLSHFEICECDGILRNRKLQHKSLIWILHLRDHVQNPP